LLDHSELDPVTGCRNWTGATYTDGYGQVWVEGRGQKAHRVAYEAFVGSTNGLHVCHHCDNTKCINPAHLFLGTDSDNVQDKCSKGRARGGVMCGVQHPRHILTDQQVADIRTTPLVRGTITMLAQTFGVDKTTISRIVRGKTWRHK